MTSNKNCHFPAIKPTTAGIELLEVIDINLSREQAILIAKAILPQLSKTRIQLYEVEAKQKTYCLGNLLWDNGEQNSNRRNRRIG